MNTALQYESPRIHVMLPILLEFLREILSMFLKPSVVSDSDDLLKIDYKNPENHKTEIFVGSDVKKFIAEQGESKFDLEMLKKNALSFYVHAVDYMLLKLPFRSSVLKHVQVADVKKRQACSFSDVEFLLDKFPVLENQIKSRNVLSAEFSNYQTYPFPPEVCDCEIDTSWSRISSMTSASGVLMFSNLAKIMLSVLTIFHSNSDCERVFSIVKKNLTESRKDLKTETVNALLLRKLKGLSQQCCYEQKYDDKLLKSAKSATYTQLKK